MQVVLITGLLTIMVSTGLVVVIMGQYKELATVQQETDRVTEDFIGAMDRVSNNEFFKDSLENVLHRGKEAVEEQEPIVSNLVAGLLQKGKEQENCNNEKRAIQEELAKTEKDIKDAEGPRKGESDAWKQEIAKLQEQLKGHSPICNFLKENHAAGELCPKPDAGLEKAAKE